MDHAGQDHLVPNACILVRRRELQDAAAPDIPPVPLYGRLNVARLVHDHWPRVDVLDGEVEIAPGVHCMPMPGYTRALHARFWHLALIYAFRTQEG